MEKILRIFDSHEAAEQASQIEDNLLTPEQRFAAFMDLMVPHYAASPRLQRIYRVDDIRERKIRDDWGVRLQPLPQPESNR